MTVQKKPMSENENAYQWLMLGFISLIIGTLAFGGFFMGKTVYTIVQAIQNPLVLVAAPTPPVAQQDKSGCTHVLLLGGGGKEYDDGSELVDSIMVASLCHQPDQLVFTSIPRDLMVQINNYGYRKINTLYILAKHQLGEERAFDLMLEGVRKVTDFPINYYAYVDFQGFTKIVDSIAGQEGLEINVDPGFIDREFPGPNYSYITVKFEKGLQRLTGTQALQFARSRHGVNLSTGESVASDFDRSRRQQQVILALKERAKDILFSGDVTPMLNTLNALQESYQTNIPFQDMLSLASLWKKVDQTQTFNVVLKEGPGELLYVPSVEERNQYYGGAWCLLPDGGNFKLIHQYLERVLANPERALQGTVNVEVLNGTKTPGLAGQIANKIMHKGITILSQYGVRNTYNRKAYDKTYIIDRTGTNTELVNEIQKTLGNAEILTETTEPFLYSSVGVTVIVGQDSISSNQNAINNSNIDIENYQNNLR